MAFTWVNAHADGQAAGFSYFNLYVNPNNAQIVGWVARVLGASQYLFYYFLGQTGEGIAKGVRGSAQHAMEAVDGVVARDRVTAGLLQEAAGTSGGQFPFSIPELAKHILAHEVLQQKRGW
jgi:hypothetical protein